MGTGQSRVDGKPSPFNLSRIGTSQRSLTNTRLQDQNGGDSPRKPVLYIDFPAGLQVARAYTFN